MFYSSPINTNNITNFIPYEKLTKEDVSVWINSIPEIHQYRQDIITVINNKLCPPPPKIIFLPSPF
jgi:hypothetical protein